MPPLASPILPICPCGRCSPFYSTGNRLPPPTPPEPPENSNRPLNFDGFYRLGNVSGDWVVRPPHRSLQGVLSCRRLGPASRFRAPRAANPDVKIVTFREVLEAATLQVSFLTVLAHCNNLTAKDSDQLIAHLQLGRLTREKFNKVLYWIQHTKSAINHVQQTDFEQNKVQVPKNWKSPEDQKPKECLSIKGVLCLRDSCKIFFHAFIGEILFPYPWRCDRDKEQLYLRKTLLEMSKIKITDDIICVGCMTCGSPMNSRFPSNKSNFPLYCGNSSNYVHDIGQIYRPFLLHVWDHTGVVTLLVKNRAATILFGNLTAKKVYKCYKQESVNHNPALVHNKEFHSSNLMGFTGDNDPKAGSDANAGNSCRNKPNFYQIWLILIKVLLQQQEHPFLIKVAVDKEKDFENGRFELTSLRMPCHISERP